MNPNSQNMGKRPATILRAHIEGVNKLSQNADPESLTRFLNNVYELVEAIFAIYDGRVEKFSGEEITAVFGIPDYTEKTPINTVSASLELQNKINELVEEDDSFNSVSIKIGIQAGHVLVGQVGNGKDQKTTLLGEPIMEATRICELAEPGRILTGQGIFQHSKEKFDFLILEPVPIKGKKKLLPVFELKGRKRTPLPTSVKHKRMIKSALVGRNEELKLLQNLVMQLINGRGTVVNIIGKAGVGKSRLMAEIKQSDLIEKIALFEGRALSNGHNLSFHPIIQIIKSWAGITEKDTSDEAKNKLENNIRRIYPEAIEEIFPFIATMMGYRLDGKAKDRIEGIEGEALENLILKNLRDLLSRAASLRLLVIVIEDAHWCDRSSLVFMESLFKLVKKQRLLFVNVFRPGYKDTGERLQKFLSENLKDHHNEILIESLTKEESNELINNLLHKIDLPDEINDLIIERSGGNPFFIEEVIRSFLDEGLIEIKDDRFILTENIKYANIPETIDAVLLNRIDRLDDKTKNLLRTASVIGRNFYYKVLEEAAQTIEEVDNKLEYLKDVQLINERKQKDEVEFLFKHALTQQAAYESIMEKTRKDLHLKIATSIERVFDKRINEFYGTLAHHYNKAGQAEKAEEYLIKAGEESMKSGASSEAVTFFRQALELFDQTESKQNQQKIIDLEEKLAFALAITGQCIESIEYCEKLIAHYYKPLPKSDFRRFIDLVVNIVLLYRITLFRKYNNESKSNEVNRKLLKILVIESNATAFVDPRRLFFNTPYAARFFKKNQYGKDDALTIMSAGPVFLHTGILFNLGKKLVEWGKNFIDEETPLGWIRGKFCVAMLDYDVGKKVDVSDEEKVVKYAIRVGEFFHSTNYYFFSSLNTIESGDDKLTQHFMERILQISEAFDSSASLSLYHRLNITYNIKFRRLDEMIKITDDVVHFLRERNLLHVLIIIYSYRTLAFTLQSKLSDARANLKKAEKIAKSFKIITSINIYYIVKCHFEIAEFKKDSGKGKDTKKVLKTSAKLIRLAHKVRKNLPEAYRLRATIFWLKNKPGKALRNFEKSIKAGLSYDCNLELSRTWFEAGKFLQDPSNKKTRVNGLNATECLLKAKSMFEEMNLEWDLKEYEIYMEGGGKPDIKQLS